MRLPSGDSHDAQKKNRAEMEANERQGWRFVGYHKEGAHTYADYVKISRQTPLLTYEESKALVELRMKQ